MSAERRVTRVARVSYRAALEGIATLPEGVSYVWVGGVHDNGEFPHTPVAQTSLTSCDATLMLTVRSIDPLDLWCTRLIGHEGQHVAHLERGRPIAAWTDEP